MLDLRYCYTCGAGNNGNVWSHTIQNLGVTQSFGYDAFNRLTSATETSGGFGQSYVYDAFGNRAVTQNSTQLDTPRTPVQNSDSTLPFNANNQWTLATYDPNGTGNQTGMGSDTFQYDAENRLRQSTQNNVTATYDYDGESRRVRKISGSTATIYVYDAMGEVAAEYGGTPAPVGGTSYVAVDTLGSSRAEVDSQGNVTRHDYLPFGQEIPNSWGVRVYYNDYARADGFTRKFTGKERDGETGLDYFGARYVSSVQGRFTSSDLPFADQDPGDPQSWNLYTYGRNNPLRYVDPRGRVATVTVDTDGEHKRGTITINATVAFYAADDSSQKTVQTIANFTKEDVEKAWSGTYEKDGITYTVKTTVDVQVYGGEREAMASGAQNVVGVQQGTVGAPDAQGNVAVAEVSPRGVGYSGPDRALFSTASDRGSRAHEFGHMLGVGHHSGAYLMDPIPVGTRATQSDFGWAFGQAVVGQRLGLGRNPQLGPIPPSTMTLKARPIWWFGR